jgi:hypothetical protein
MTLRARVSARGKLFPFPLPPADVASTGDGGQAAPRPRHGAAPYRAGAHGCTPRHPKSLSAVRPEAQTLALSIKSIRRNLLPCAAAHGGFSQNPHRWCVLEVRGRREAIRRGSRRGSAVGETAGRTKSPHRGPALLFCPAPLRHGFHGRGPAQVKGGPKLGIDLSTAEPSRGPAPLRCAAEAVMDRDTPSGRPNACHVHPVAELKMSPRTPPSTGRAATRRGTEPTTSSPPAAICCRP